MSLLFFMPPLTALGRLKRAATTTPTLGLEVNFAFAESVCYPIFDET